MAVPLLDLKAQHATIREDVVAALMEVVDVLGDDGNFEDILKLEKSFVRGVWLTRLHALTTLVVEPKHARRVFLPPLGGGNKRNGLPLPQTSRSTEGIEPALSADARSGKYYNVSLAHLVLSVNVLPLLTQELHPYRGTHLE